MEWDMTGTKRMFCLAVVLMHPLVALAGADRTWTVGGAEQFAAGRQDGVSVLTTGELALGPAVQKIAGMEANYVWDLSVGQEDAIYVGTGSPAAVYVLRGDKLDLVHKTSEKHVLSVLALEDGSALAATAPRGIIYRISAAGTVTVFKELPDTYVWDMALGPEGRKVYCATGPKGELISLDMAGGEPTVVQTQQEHLLCLAVDPSGNVFAGSAPGGLIYRISPDGARSVVFDADETEVRCLFLSRDGVLYAGTAQADDSSGSAAAPAEAEAAAMPRPGPGPGSAPEPAAFPGSPTVPNSVYMTPPGGGPVRLAQMPNTLVLCIAPDEGGVLVGTGSRGQLIGVTDLGVGRVATGFSASHISAMVRDSSGSLVVATSNGGGLWRAAKGYAGEGTFTSKVFDAGYLARWGRIWWKGTLPPGSGVKASLKTGNSRKPDETWSEWSAPAERPSGKPLEMPMGRFAQMQLTITTTDPATTPLLIQACASHRQVNRRPRVQRFRIDGQPPSDPRQEEPPGRPPKPPVGKRAVQWEANDPNGDKLVVDLYYRAVDEGQWKVVETDIEDEPRYEWETDRVPDGHYLLRLVASDRLVRGPDEVLEAEVVTAPFVIDNRRPEVLDLQATAQEDGSYVIKGSAKDSYSNIEAVQVSCNSQEWRPVFPSDGIFDATAEGFSYRTDPIDKGEHVLVFAATDAAGNVGTDKIVITIE